ncbi:MAG: phytanoyl-CoA dioxygenase family protein [Kiritimatiellales bacterium]|nr:phytanoyl-CoA dioxygenase family protein [Kiritimatiellales bacterium]
MKHPIESYENAMDLLSDPAQLKIKADADGYLFFKGLLPPASLLEVRRQILEILDRHGLLEKQAEILDGRMDLSKIAQCVPFEGCTLDVYKAVQRLESFQRLSHHPDLIRVYQALFGTEVLPHPRNIARVLFPGPQGRATPPHQDYIHIQGTQQTWTAWFPLGNCPVELGGLSVLKESHREGIFAVRGAEGAGGLETILCDKGNHWLKADFEVGDVLTFTSTTVHRGLPNQMGNLVRISCDFRYQPLQEPIEKQSLLPHGQVLTWEEIYKDWKRADLQYYWENKPLEISPWDESIRWQKERIC